MASIAGMVDLLSVRKIRMKITAWCHAVLAVMMNEGYLADGELIYTMLSFLAVVLLTKVYML